MKYNVITKVNPYRVGTMKCELMKWALEQESFTYEEFKTALYEIKTKHEFVSRMKSDLAKAWWNEFKNKQKDFVLIAE